MKNPSLSSAVETFAASTHHFTDVDLDRSWSWKDYQEGVRFAFFRTYEQLCELAARLEVERAASPHPLTVVQRILGQYHAAYRDLQAILLGITDEQSAQVPGIAPGGDPEWSLRQVLAHIVDADRGFLTAIILGLEHIRKEGTEPFEITEEIWNNFWADDPFNELRERGSLPEIQAYHARLHARILLEISPLPTADLGLLTRYWESEPFSLEFRLHRFSSHLRQHAIQAEKTLAMLGCHPSEALRLLRMVYNALAAVENVNIGDESFGLDRRANVAAEIDQRRIDIMQAVGSISSV